MKKITVFIPPSQSRYQLSGIRYRTTAFNVPADPNVAYIRSWDKGKAGKLYRFTCRCNPAFQCDESQLHCYQFHTYCWDLTEEHLGPELEGNLDTLVMALKYSWGELPSEETDRLHSYRGHYGGPFWLADLMNNEYYLQNDGDPRPPISAKEQFFVLSDPSCISGIQKALENSKRNKDDAFDNSNETQLKASCKGPVDLPPELQLLVLDFLSDILDIGNAAAAFRWHLPDLYWRSRIPCDVFYELNDIPSDEVDWESLAIELGKLLRGCWVLENRMRILRLLYYVRDRFLGMVAQLYRSESESSEIH